MDFDFKEAYIRVSGAVAEQTNRKLEELHQSGNGNFGEILNVMLNSSIATTAQVMEEYHQALMNYLKEKGL